MLLTVLLEAFVEEILMCHLIRCVYFCIAALTVCLAPCFTVLLLYAGTYSKHIGRVDWEVSFTTQCCFTLY